MLLLAIAAQWARIERLDIHRRWRTASFSFFPLDLGKREAASCGANEIGPALKTSTGLVVTVRTRSNQQSGAPSCSDPQALSRQVLLILDDQVMPQSGERRQDAVESRRVAGSTRRRTAASETSRRRARATSESSVVINLFLSYRADLAALANGLAAIRETWEPETTARVQLC
jgi:hypothetical protein